MQHDEPWQIFADNGLAIDGRSALREQFAGDEELTIGATHVWIWRRLGKNVEVLLQKRSSTKRTWPGFYDISAAGHVDASETFVESAVREAKEEIGLDIDPRQLFFLFSLRASLDVREIDTIYLYELAGEVDFRFDDGEVDGLEWIELGEFEKRVSDPDSYHIVPQGHAYFELLLMALKRFM